MLPQVSRLEFTTEEITNPEVIHRSFKWDFKEGDFVLVDGRLVEVSGLEYLKVWIEKAIRTEANTSFYTAYGSNHHSLIGSVFDKDFVQSEIERMVTEALLKNDAITAVGNFEFEFEGSLLTMKFTVTSIYGEMGVEINGS